MTDPKAISKVLMWDVTALISFCCLLIILNCSNSLCLYTIVKAVSSLQTNSIGRTVLQFLIRKTARSSPSVFLHISSLMINLLSCNLFHSYSVGLNCDRILLLRMYWKNTVIASKCYYSDASSSISSGIVPYSTWNNLWIIHEGS